MKLNKAESELLLPIGCDQFAGTKDELCEEVKNTYWVIDDSPFPYWERQKQMKVLEDLAVRLGFQIGL